MIQPQDIMSHTDSMSIFDDRLHASIPVFRSTCLPCSDSIPKLNVGQRSLVELVEEKALVGSMKIVAGQSVAQKNRRDTQLFEEASRRWESTLPFDLTRLLCPKRPLERL